MRFGYNLHCHYVTHLHYYIITRGMRTSYLHILQLLTTVVWKKFTVGIFHVRKLHVKIFSSSWVKHSHLLPYLFNSKNISCVIVNFYYKEEEGYNVVLTVFTVNSILRIINKAGNFSYT